MNERITEIRNFLNLSQKDFAEKIGLKQGSLSDLETGRANITERIILLICSQFNVNEEWLRFGNGQMFQKDKKQNEFFEIFDIINPVLQDFLIEVAKDLLDDQKKL